MSWQTGSGNKIEGTGKRGTEKVISTKKKILSWILAGVLLVLFLPLKDTEKALSEAKQIAGEIQEEKPKIALTFDDGPHPVYTEKLLDGLKQRGVSATFFLIGSNMEGREDLVLRMKDEGHLIGNHTYHHVKLSEVSTEEAKEEILTVCEKIFQITGNFPAFVRPPFGVWKKGLDFQITMIPVSWNVDSKDWTTKNTEEIVKRVVKDVKEDDIILMHDIFESSVQAALEIVDVLREQGYEFVTVEELLLK